MKTISDHTATVLSIAGFDPSGGAGVQVDAKTIHALGAYAFAATTSITAQNSLGVFGVEAVSPQMLKLQLTTLLDDVKVDAVKIGMLANASLINVVVDVLKQYELPNIVLDPVMVSSSGKRLLDEEAVEVMVQRLFPLCRLITPNLMETNALLGTRFKGEMSESIVMANGLFKLGADTVLLKGGHGCEKEAVDCLVDPKRVDCFGTPWVETSHTHGTGCLLSSAIASYLAQGFTLKSAVKGAKDFLYEKLQASAALKLHYVAENKNRKEPIF